MHDRRSQILRAALDCFVTKGFHGTSTREICRTAGISSGLIFHYFPTKEAVYEELVRHALTSLPIDLDEALQDPLGALGRLVESMLELLTQHPEAARVFRLVNQAQYQRGISPVVDQLFAEHDLITALIPVIEAGQEQGLVRPGHPRALTTALLTAVQGLAEELAIHPDQPVPEVDWYLDLIRTPSS